LGGNAIKSYLANQARSNAVQRENFQELHLVRSWSAPTKRPVRLSNDNGTQLATWRAKKSVTKGSVSKGQKRQ
jgi:hypothetical protein